MREKNWLRIVGVSVVLAICLAADGSWLQHVPDNDRKKVNPFAGQADAIAAGGRVFDDHCAKCHGEDALGHGKSRACAAIAFSTQQTARFFGY